MRYCIVLSNESILKINKWKFNASMLHIKCRNYRVLISRTLIKISWKQNWYMWIDFTKYFTNAKTTSTHTHWVHLVTEVSIFSIFVQIWIQCKFNYYVHSRLSKNVKKRKQNFTSPRTPTQILTKWSKRNLTP